MTLQSRVRVRPGQSAQGGDELLRWPVVVKLTVAAGPAEAGAAVAAMAGVVNARAAATVAAEAIPVTAILRPLRVNLSIISLSPFLTDREITVC
jgi:hypothetical protein